MLAAGTDRARLRALALLALAAAALHFGLLGGFERTGPAPGPAPAPVLQVRSVAPEPVPASLPVPPATAPVVVTLPPRAALRAIPALPRVRAASAVELASVAEAQAGMSAASAPVDEAAVAVPASEVLPASVVAALAAPAPSAGGEPPPVYTTRLPPPVTLDYELQRGRLSGSGELRWQPEGGRYRLSLEGRVLGLNALTQVSQGTLEAAGLAPQRFTDQRLRRAVQAANFQREGSRITFSGPSTELPLWPGVQDRLSWMIQLAGIAEAEPQRLAPGERIVLQVIGARGDASLWAFRSLGREPIDTPAGSIDAVHLSREARGPYDTGVEVWLDPARHHLPIRATLRSGADEDLLDLRLRALMPGP